MAAGTEEFVDTVNMEVAEAPADSSAVTGLNDVVNPLGTPPPTLAERDTVPENPVLLREIVDVADLPAARPMLAGLTVIV